MKINYQDITDGRTLAYNLLQNLSNEAKKLEEEAKRIRDLERYLSYMVVNKEITDTDEIECAISWLKHSNLSSIEITKKIS